jgi:hypothetical protein
MTGLTVALTTMMLTVAALGQSNSSAIKNAYSLGEDSVSRIGVRWIHTNNQQDPTVLADVAAIDQAIQRHAQKLGIDPQQILTVLKGIDPNSPYGNPMSSHTEPLIEAILNAHGSGDKVVKAYALGWKTSAYSQTCALALASQQLNPGFASSVRSAYPAMVQQLQIGAADFGVQVSSPQAGLSLAATCNELKTTVTSLNHALQVH